MNAMTGGWEEDRLIVSAKCLPKLLILFFLTTGVLTLSACIISPFSEQNAHPDIPLVGDAVNRTEASETPPIGENGNSEEDYFIGLALSGGGSRAANFSAAVMWQLNELGILKEVQYI